MTFTINALRPPTPVYNNDPSPSDDSDPDDSMQIDSHRPAKHPEFSSKNIVTPGETVTDDPQWMRGHGTYNPTPTAPTILSSVAGTLLRTNKLLSIHPLRARYTPEIGDLVIGRILTVETRRWKVDLGAPLLAHLPLSAINLPGGILRKRTTTDELAIREFFREGELLVAEVQSVFQDGAASLHTRSLRYGKLRSGVFLRVSGAGGGRGGGVVRSRRQVWTVPARNGGCEIDVVLGVNGFVWICKHGSVGGADVAGGGADSGGGGGSGTGSGGPTGGVGRKIGITRLEDAVDERMYSARNEEVGAETRREIARLAGCVRALVQGGVRVDEDMVMRAYEASLGIEEEGMDVDGEDGESGEYLGGERGLRVVAEAVAASRE